MNLTITSLAWLFNHVFSNETVFLLVFKKIYSLSISAYLLGMNLKNKISLLLKALGNVHIYATNGASKLANL